MLVIDSFVYSRIQGGLFLFSSENITRQIPHFFAKFTAQLIILIQILDTFVLSYTDVVLCWKNKSRSVRISDRC